MAQRGARALSWLMLAGCIACATSTIDDGREAPSSESPAAASNEEDSSGDEPIVRGRGVDPSAADDAPSPPYQATPSPAPAIAEPLVPNGPTVDVAPARARSTTKPKWSIPTSGSGPSVRAVELPVTNPESLGRELARRARGSCRGVADVALAALPGARVRLTVRVLGDGALTVSTHDSDNVQLERCAREAIERLRAPHRLRGRAVDVVLHWVRQ
jgi:hypothetical protein